MDLVAVRPGALEGSELDYVALLRPRVGVEQVMTVGVVTADPVTDAAEATGAAVVLARTASAVLNHVLRRRVLDSERDGTSGGLTSQEAGEVHNLTIPARRGLVKHHGGSLMEVGF